MTHCNICLKSGEGLAFITDFDKSGGAQIITKLANVVPEVQWSENYKICLFCSENLDQAYKFRNLCISCNTKLELKLEAEIFNCFHCNQGFNDKTVLAEHIQQEHTIQMLAEPHKPNIKKKTLKRDSKNIKHKFSCQVCNLTAKYAKFIIEHCTKEHSIAPKSIKPYTCDLCPMRFSTSANLIQHKKYHEGSRTNICSFCGKAYITKSDLTVHEYTHFNRRNYKCESCDKAFNTNKNLRSHILVVHTASEMWKHNCEICHKKFPLKSGFDQHMRRHTGDKPFVCHVCYKPFVSRSEMQKHFKYHSKVRPFKCAHCPKTYREQKFCDIHLAKEHGIGDVQIIPVTEKKFVCHVCPSTFYDKIKLERHLCTHTGVKPFDCAHCHKKFSDKYYFKQHLKTIHNVNHADTDSGRLKILDNSLSIHTI